MLVDLRSAVVADIDSVLELWQAAAENDGRPTDTRQAVLALIRRDRDALILAENNGELIGTVIAGWDGWRYHLYRLAVRPDWRLRGVATALLTAAENRLLALGATRMDAMVLVGNEHGQRLWKARGYQEQDDWRRWIKGGVG